MNCWRRTKSITILATLFLVAQPRTFAFSLLGPYADWMAVSNCYRGPHDIGGPVAINEAYRWNVPTITYGFDDSFLDYFGSNGVAAVEAAIQILNALPPASTLALTNFPPISRQFNQAAWDLELHDLKSMALALLVRQMGLGEPVRNCFDLVKWWPGWSIYPGNDWPSNAIPDYIMERNYDPEALTATDYVNDTFFWLVPYSDGKLSDIVEYAVDPESPIQTSVAEWFEWVDRGSYLTGLTRDDAGGLRYLLSTNTIRYEPLLAGVRGAAANASNYVSVALRPGVDKIYFVSHPRDPVSGQFIAFTNEFTDSYITNNQLMSQQLVRITATPDILFSVADIGSTNSSTIPYASSPTSTWSNNAAINGSAIGQGPGIIVPPQIITFHKIGPYIGTLEMFQNQNDYTYVSDSHYGSFDTNEPVTFPLATAQNRNVLSLRIRLRPVDAPIFSQLWSVPVASGGRAFLQASTNLTDWTSLGTVTNTGGVAEWNYYGASRAQRFFRVIPE